MERVSVEAVENSVQPAAVMRPLTEALGLTDLAINYYELEPGDSFAFAYHSHEIQEEVFYVQSGTATFETEDGPVEVSAGELVRFGRGEFQRGWNRGDERVVALALGAPLAYGDQPKLRYCEGCGERTHNSLGEADDGEARVATCTECGAETGRWYRGSMPGTVP
ncbi:MAG: cupin domain-containing protein [Halobacteriaceae archaeon]